MKPKPIVFDTGSGCKVIREEPLPPGWEGQIIHSADLPALGDVKKTHSACAMRRGYVSGLATQSTVMPLPGSRGGTQGS